MNNPFVQEQARKLMERPGIAAQKTPEAKVRQLYRVVFGRSPSVDELALAVGFVNRAGGSADSAATETAAWQYGFGGYSEATHRVQSFTALPHFTGNAWQGGAKLPDPKLGWVTLNAQGGHPGDNLEHSAIRRWVAPADVTLSIHGAVNHPSEQGDGIRALIVSSRAGVVGEWIVHHDQVEAKVDRVEVRKGDTIDFVVECRANNGFDSFNWSPGLTVTGGTAAQPSWEASADFSGPPGEGPKPLSAWEAYAQALLLSNEFLFID
jgi:hypothetical protein